MGADRRKFWGNDWGCKEKLNCKEEKYNMKELIEIPNILVVCGRNKRRSRTAEHIFKNDQRFHVRSAGLSPKSDRKISEKDLTWADLVLVMEVEQRAKIWKMYKHLPIPDIEILMVPDEYEFMEEELVELLTDKINETLHRLYSI